LIINNPAEVTCISDKSLDEEVKHDDKEEGEDV